MRKYLLLFLMIGIINTTFAQARIGHSLAEIREEYKYGYNLKTEYDEDNDEIVKLEFDDRYAYHFFTSDNYCYMSIIQMKTSPLVQGQIEYYNSQYVIVSPTKWRWYSPEGVIECEFKSINEVMYFIWSRPN